MARSRKNVFAFNLLRYVLTLVVLGATFYLKILARENTLFLSLLSYLRLNNNSLNVISRCYNLGDDSLDIKIALSKRERERENYVHY